VLVCPQRCDLGGEGGGGRPVVFSGALGRVSHGVLGHSWRRRGRKVAGAARPRRSAWQPRKKWWLGSEGVCGGVTCREDHEGSGATTVHEVGGWWRLQRW
jgi:hypothetical protein